MLYDSFDIMRYDNEILVYINQIQPYYIYLLLIIDPLRVTRRKEG